MLRASSVLLVCLLSASIACQGSAEDYQRATERIAAWSKAGGSFDPEVHWMPDGVWFATGRGKQRGAEL